MKKRAPIKNDGVFYEDVRRILAEARRQTYTVINFAMVAFPDFEKSYALRRELAWTHRLAMRVENPAVRLADSRGGLVCPPKVATASSRCNETRRQGCRRHLRAESPTGNSVGQRPTFGAKRILSPVRATAIKACALTGLGNSFESIRRALPYATACRAFSPFDPQKHSFVMRWNVLKTRLKSKGNELVTKCHQLKWEAVSFK